ncbi:hypothetical protein, conserved [Eimeria tenella]|uniref:ACB domain-containing protein n=1 Tax=Eimeria tenella TaxID=5802 RepID=U6KLQ8_EIMTE|nr:hypothetical protein, conserved [Eimeria tenella]CDJ39032.1 hypothetical protein, conserved [Eimeria tenella]|eukprot:XP_013229787.1 hypothetical protein, conserved [Eimeria tenella]
MAGVVSMDSVPEALLMVAEKTLNSDPLFLGLSGQQLSRIAREVYAHLKKNGRDALAQQAHVLTDPQAVAKALQQLQKPQNQEQQQQQTTTPGTSTTCPCCIQRAAHLGATPVVAPQPQIVPVVLQQQPQWPLQLPLQQQAFVPQLGPPQPQQHGQTPEGHAHLTVSPIKQQQLQQQQQPQQQPEQQQQQTSQCTSTRGCVARLLFAIVAAKLARDALQRLQQTRSSSSSNRRATAADSAPSGMGSVSVESLGAALQPEKGLFAGLQKDLLLSLQRVVAAAVDGINAAMEATGISSGEPKKNARGGPFGGPVPELPPLYSSKAEQGRTQLTVHEKYAGELIQKLLDMKDGRPVESISLDAGSVTPGLQQPKQQTQQQRQQQQQQQQQQARVAVRHSEQRKVQKEPSKQQPLASGPTQPESEEQTLDAEFKAFVKAAENYKGPNPLSVEQQLRFYGLFKRATAGPCTAKQPSRFNIREYKKWEAWKACDKLSALEAKREYVQRARELKKTYSRL